MATPLLSQKEKVREELNQRILGNSSCLKSFLSTTPQLLPFWSLIWNINKTSYLPNMKGSCIFFFWEETRCDALVSKNSLEAIWFLPSEVPYLWFCLCDFMSHKATPFPCLWLLQSKTRWHTRDGLGSWHLGDNCRFMPSPWAPLKVGKEPPG